MDNQCIILLKQNQTIQAFKLSLKGSLFDYFFLLLKWLFCNSVTLDLGLDTSILICEFGVTLIFFWRGVCVNLFYVQYISCWCNVKSYHLSTMFRLDIKTSLLLPLGYVKLPNLQRLPPPNLYDYFIKDDQKRKFFFSLSQHFQLHAFLALNCSRHFPRDLDSISSF